MNEHRRMVARRQPKAIAIAKPTPDTSAAFAAIACSGAILFLSLALRVLL